MSHVGNLSKKGILQELIYYTDLVMHIYQFINYKL